MGLQPWRAESFKFSADPQLEAKVRDVTGLYLNPPDKAIVLCVDDFTSDEKPQTQALERQAPVLPLRPGVPEKRSHGVPGLPAAGRQGLPAPQAAPGLR